MTPRILIDVMRAISGNADMFASAVRKYYFRRFYSIQSRFIFPGPLFYIRYMLIQLLHYIFSLSHVNAPETL